jgi:hypothetical protein
MKYSQFKQNVLGFVNRNSEVFNKPNTDLVLSSMNDVRRAAQREYTFNLNRISAFVEVSMIGQSLLEDFYAAPVATDSIVAKQVEALYEYRTTAVGATAVYGRTAKIRFHSLTQMQRELAGGYHGDSRTVYVRNNETQELNSFCYLQGTKLFHSSSTTPTWIMADVVEFLPDHDGGSEQDIFLTYFADWLKWSTILDLNQYLNKNDRFQLDLKMIDGLWESVRQFDAQQAASTGSISLD